VVNRQPSVHCGRTADLTLHEIDDLAGVRIALLLPFLLLGLAILLQCIWLLFLVDKDPGSIFSAKGFVINRRLKSSISFA